MQKAAIGLAIVIGIAACNRSNNPTTTTGSTDYRKLTQAELVKLIATTLRNDGITLGPDGPNRYKGKIKSPDGTIDLPLEVTVEEQRIVLLTKTPAGNTSDIITPRGLQSGPLEIK